MNNKKIYINGRFLTQNITGVQRYAIEILKVMDRIENAKDIIVLCPKDIIHDLDLKNIKIKSIGHFKGYFWEQISLPLYILKNSKKSKLINFCNIAPIIYPGYTVIHDISFKTHPEHLNRLFAIIYRIITKLNIKRYKHIFTVSEFSKNEIVKNYKISPEKITITYNSAEHLKNIEPDFSIIEKLNLKDKDFYFSLGSKSPHKNHKLILNLAKNYKNETFIVTGNNNVKIFNDSEDKTLSNVIYTGYLTDNEICALYKNCKAFIFPSLHEGFGIPPLEAITCGCDSIILSDISVLREIYGKVGNYIDLKESKFEIDCLKTINTDEKKYLMQKYSWKESCKKVIEKIME